MVDVACVSDSIWLGPVAWVELPWVEALLEDRTPGRANSMVDYVVPRDTFCFSCMIVLVEGFRVASMEAEIVLTVVL